MKIKCRSCDSETYFLNAVEEVVYVKCSDCDRTAYILSSSEIEKLYSVVK